MLMLHTVHFCMRVTHLCSTTSHPTGPGYPGYPGPPVSQPARPTPPTVGPDSTQLSAAVEEVGGVSSSSDAPPASQSPPAATTVGSNSATNTASHGHGRTGLFQSQKGSAGISQPLLEPHQSFAFSARSLSIAASADGEGGGARDETEQQSEEASSQTSTHSATFTIGVEEDVDMMEIRQRRLQRFHSLPTSQPGRRDDDGGGSDKTGETGHTGNETDTGVRAAAASDGVQAES